MTPFRVLLGALGSIAAMGLAACGDVYADPDSAPIVVADAGVADSSTPPVFPNDRPTTCPASRPRENSSCSSIGSACEFGTSADRECNAVLACSGADGLGSWGSRPADRCFAKTFCPETGDVASLDGRPCSLDATDGGAPVTDNDEAVCNMTDGVCACTTGPDGATRHERKWVCAAPVSVCPPNRPLLGAPCNGTLWCDYGSCAFKRGLLMECTQNVWLTGGASCQ